MARTLVEKRTDWAGIGFAAVLSVVIVLPLLVVFTWSVTNVWRYPSVIPQEFGLRFWGATLARAGVDALELSTEGELLGAIVRFIELRRQRTRAAPGGGVPAHLRKSA